MRAVILCGGHGSRMQALFPDLPKALIPVGGASVLSRQLRALADSGVTEVHLMTGYLSGRIEAWLAAHPFPALRIVLHREAEPMGSAGALYALAQAWTEDFFLLNGDLVFDFDFRALGEYHRAKQALITLAVHPGSHPGDSTLVAMNADGSVSAFGRELPVLKNRSNAGIALVSPEVFAALRAAGRTLSGPLDLDRDIIAPAVATGRVFAWETAEYIKDMGTPQRLAQVERELALSIPAMRSKRTKRRAVFLDRDGTLNRPAGYITAPEQLCLCDGAAAFVRQINRSGALAVVVTNQPVIARGDIDRQQLDVIHGRLEQLLGEGGAYLDDIFVCPHHPDAGFPGERKELKIDCGCRKPKPGLLLEAAKKYNIDLTASYLVGDSDADTAAGIAAGCRTLQLGREISSLDQAAQLLFRQDGCLADAAWRSSDE